MALLKIDLLKTIVANLLRQEIALFCKFWSVGQLVRFANVCNVRWLP